MEKPISLNGNGALGNTGVLVIAAGVTLNENVDLPAGAAATISVVSGAALFLPDGANVDLDSTLTVNVAAAGAALISRPIIGTGDLDQGGRGAAPIGKNQHVQRPDHHSRRRVGDEQRHSTRQSGGPGWGDAAGHRHGRHDQRDRDRRHDQRRGSNKGDRLDSSSVTMNPTTTFAVEVNGDSQHDELVVSGTVTLDNAVLSVTGILGREPFVIINNDSNDAVVGTFAGLPEGAWVMVDGLPTPISYTGGDGNDVVLGVAAPTAVRMASMSARRTEKGVVLEWHTGYEVDNLGFHVYRGSNNGRVRLSTTPLTGSGLLASPGIEMRHRPHVPLDRRVGWRRCPRCRVLGGGHRSQRRAHMARPDQTGDAAHGKRPCQRA